jgi:hypothetical protein
VDNALIGQVVGIEEERLPVGRERAIVDSEAVVLRSYVTLGCLEINARLVHASEESQEKRGVEGKERRRRTPVSKFHFVSFCSGRQSQELVSCR